MSRSFKDIKIQVMKKNTLILLAVAALGLGFLAYRYFLKKKAKVSDDVIAQNSNTVAKPVTAVNGSADVIPASRLAIYFGPNVMVGNYMLGTGDKVEVVKNADNTYTIIKILANPNYSPNSVIVPASQIQ